jgi:phage terminase Nu1 subunit (DNA packaging protein)
MADEQQAQPAADQNQLDPAFFTCVNEYLELTNKQSQQQGLKRISLASLYAAARFNTHVYLSSVGPGQAAGDRANFLDYMSTMYRRMLNEHLDGLGQERNIDVGESELAAEYAAAGVQVGRMGQTPATDYVAAAGATPPAASNE